MLKKKPTSAHISKATGNHPGSGFRLFSIIERVDDPREASPNFHYPLTTILFTVIACSLCGANNWEAIAMQANEMIDWLGKFVDVSKGVPCARTFKRIFNVLCPVQMESMLIAVMDLLREKKEGDVISFDGKSLRGTRSSEGRHTAIHILNAWSQENGICIGQKRVDDKSNEIVAMPELIALLDLKGTIVTADALNTQKNIATKVIEVDADYVFPVKSNHPTLLEEIELLFNEALAKDFRGFDADSYETLEKSHGRVEGRKYYSIDAEGLPSTKDWPKLCSVGMVVRERSVKGKSTKEIEYYISSCGVDAKLLERVVRGHWGIENSLHWVLDVTFREDMSRYRDKIGAQNLAIVRKTVLGALSRDTRYKCGKEGKRLMAAMNSDYRESILKNLF